MPRKNCNPVIAIVCLAVLAVLVQPATCGVFDLLWSFPRALFSPFRSKLSKSSNVYIDIDSQVQAVETSGKKSIELMNSKIPATELAGLIMAKKYVERESGIIDLAKLYEEVPTEEFAYAIGKFVRAEFGLLYPSIKHFPEDNAHKAFIENKVYKPCKKVNEYLNNWWKSVSNIEHGSLSVVRRLPREQLVWLKMQTICNKVLKSETNETLPWLEKAYSNFGSSIVEDYKSQELHSTWFRDRIKGFLRLIIPDYVDRLLGLLSYVNNEMGLSQSELHTDEVGTAVLVKGLAGFMKRKLESDTGSVSKNVEEKFVVPCKSVHKLLEGWWEDNHHKLYLSQIEVTWLTVENICSHLLYFTANGKSRSSLIDRIKAELGELPKQDDKKGP